MAKMSNTSRAFVTPSDKRDQKVSERVKMKDKNGVVEYGWICPKDSTI